MEGFITEQEILEIVEFQKFQLGSNFFSEVQCSRI